MVGKAFTEAPADELTFIAKRCYAAVRAILPEDVAFCLVLQRTDGSGRSSVGGNLRPEYVAALMPDSVTLLAAKEGN